MALIRKTMRVGGRETCVGLEPPFWACLAELAAARRVSLAALVGQVAAARPTEDSLASALRTFALEQALALAAAGGAGAMPSPDSRQPSLP